MDNTVSRVAFMTENKTTRMIGEIRLKCAVYKTMWKVELEEWEQDEG